MHCEFWMFILTIVYKSNYIVAYVSKNICKVPKFQNVQKSYFVIIFFPVVFQSAESSFVFDGCGRRG